MDIHEAPTLSPYSKEVLKGNEVVTIEPGIYLEGKFGIRIEDTIITGRGENITSSSKELLRL
jgi:Xaa-Pro aminopeptidase